MKKYIYGVLIVCLLINNIYINIEENVIHIVEKYEEGILELSFTKESEAGNNKVSWVSIDYMNEYYKEIMTSSYPPEEIFGHFLTKYIEFSSTFQSEENLAILNEMYDNVIYSNSYKEACLSTDGGENSVTFVVKNLESLAEIFLLKVNNDQSNSDIKDSYAEYYKLIKEYLSSDSHCNVTDLLYQTSLTDILSSMETVLTKKSEWIEEEDSAVTMENFSYKEDGLLLSLANVATDISNVESTADLYKFLDEALNLKKEFIEEVNVLVYNPTFFFGLIGWGSEGTGKKISQERLDYIALGLKQFRNIDLAYSNAKDKVELDSNADGLVGAQDTEEKIEDLTNLSKEYNDNYCDEIIELYNSGYSGWEVEYDYCMTLKTKIENLTVNLEENIEKYDDYIDNDVKLSYENLLEELKKITGGINFDCSSLGEDFLTELKNIYSFILVCGTFVVIILTSIDFLNNMFDKEHDRGKEVFNTMIKRFVLLIFLFLTGVIVNFVFSEVLPELGIVSTATCGVESSE